MPADLVAVAEGCAEYVEGTSSRAAKVACVQAYISYVHLFATPVFPIPEYATGTNTAEHALNMPLAPCPRTMLGTMPAPCSRSAGHPMDTNPEPGESV
jgi:hypothetical protein